MESQFRDTPDKGCIPTIKSFKQLCEQLLPYLRENGIMFKSFGPNSGLDSKEPLRRDLTLWYKSRQDKILPNNDNMSILIEAYRFYIPEKYIEVFDKFLIHVYAFAKHCEDANFDYSHHIFPKEITNIVNDGIAS